MKNIKHLTIISFMGISSVGMTEPNFHGCSKNDSGIEKLFEKIKKTECAASGAWFYKTEQEKPDDSEGISSIFTLPKFKHDPKRYFTNPGNKLAPYTVGPLDRASVYLGGQIGGTELDAGLTWDKVYDKNGDPEVENGVEKFAFRPFWRATEKLNSDTVWHNPDRSENARKVRLNERDEDKKTRDEIVERYCNNHKSDVEKNECKDSNISFVSPGKKINMSLEVIDKFPEPKKYGNRFIVKMKIIEPFNKPFKICFITCFEHLGKPGVNQNSWKRVSSIDQFSKGPCYKDEKGNLTSNPKRPLRDNKTGKVVKKNNKTVMIDNDRMENTGPEDCRPSNEGGYVSATSATLEDMNWQSVNLLKINKTQTPLTVENSKIIVGKEFCDSKSGLGGKEEEHFIDLSKGINKLGGQSLRIIPKK
jgi:hypothetical protein